MKNLTDCIGVMVQPFVASLIALTSFGLYNSGFSARTKAKCLWHFVNPSLRYTQLPRELLEVKGFKIFGKV